MSGNDYYGAPQPPAYTPPGQQPYYGSPPPAGNPQYQQQQQHSGFPPGGAPQASSYGGYPPSDHKSPTGTPYYDPYAQQPGGQGQYFPAPSPQQPGHPGYGAYQTPSPYPASPYASPPPQQQQGGYYPPQQGGDYYGQPPADGSRSMGGTPAGYPGQVGYGVPQGGMTEYHQQPQYHHQQGPGGYHDPYAQHQPSGPGAYADGSQPGYGAPGGAADGERGLGSTLIGGGAGAFLGSKLGFGKVGGAVGGAVAANLISHYGKKKKNH